MVFRQNNTECNKTNRQFSKVYTNVIKYINHFAVYHFVCITLITCNKKNLYFRKSVNYRVNTMEGIDLPLISDDEGIKLDF